MEDARKLFESGDLHRQITRRSFDFVYAVFDRDDHLSYHAALALAESLDGRLRNDQKQKVRFVAMPSVPCFEQWLLLHYEDIQAPLHRDEVQKRLRRHLPDYDKGGKGYFERIRSNLPQAITRAQNLARQTTPHNGTFPYTAIAELVTALCQLTSPTRKVPPPLSEGAAGCPSPGLFPRGEEDYSAVPPQFGTVESGFVTLQSQSLRRYMAFGSAKNRTISLEFWLTARSE